MAVSAAAALLLANTTAARADELADLRANQQLLSARIDQLAQIGGPSTGGQPTLGSPVSHNSMIAGSFPRSFMIPGTDTSLRIGGFVDETIDYFLQNGPVNGQPSTTVEINGNLGTQPLDVHGQVVPGYGGPFPVKGFVVPVQTGHSRGNSVLQQTPQDSRLNVETRTPTVWGEAHTFTEIDFKGTNAFSATGENGQTSVSDNLIPRIRYAFGTLGGFLAGQANSNFRDADAEPETLALDGPAGMAGPIRIPQIRYTGQGPWHTSWSLSAETPQTDVLTPAGKIASDSTSQVIAGGAFVSASNPTPGGVACIANGVSIAGTTACTLAADPTKSSAPDLTAASYWARPWGHLDFRAVIRPTLRLSDGKYVDQSFVGYGGGISGDVKPGWFGWAKDDFQWQFTVGDGIGRYLTDATDAGLATNYLIAPASAAAAAGIVAKPIAEFGGVVGYQHFWVPTLRSTVVYGYARYEVSSQLIGPVESTVANKLLQTVNVNLIWSPVAFIDTGVEYVWGQRQVVANLYGTEQLLIGKFRVKF